MNFVCAALTTKDLTLSTTFIVPHEVKIVLMPENSIPHKTNADLNLLKLQ